MPRFNPYEDNGGTCSAIGGNGFVVAAADTRLSRGYNILTRDQPRIFKMTDKNLFASTGCWCDCLTFVKNLEIRVKYYRYDHNKNISTKALAALVQTMLYNKRTFPYYIGPIVCGLDENNQGTVCSYDPLGSYEHQSVTSIGNQSPVVQPYLDCLLQPSNVTNVDEEMKNITKEKAKKVLKDAYMAAAERCMYLGDSLQIVTLTPEGVEEEIFELRKD